jgi:hypothetical protein
MMTCPKCHAGVPEGMRFCLQCGTALTVAPQPPALPAAANPPVRPAPPLPYIAPAPLPISHPAAEKETSTVPLKIAATPVISPRSGSPAWQTRPSLGDPSEEIDEEALKKSFERPVTHAGAVLCRFCKGPIDLSGDFCDQCGAPVAEAAPPGMVGSKPKPMAPPVLSPLPAPLPGKPMEAAPVARPSVAGAPAVRPIPPPLPPKPVAHPPVPNPPSTLRAPGVPPPPSLPAEDPPAGLVGRLKGLFKKG